MRINVSILFAVVFFFNSAALASLRVVTTTEDLASITRSIGRELVVVSAIAKGTQDPHFIEAKPSHMVTLSRADLLLSIGLGLEGGWLPLLQRGARNPAVLPGSSGFLEVSEAITPIDVRVSADRSEGDVHPFGNPHFMADPERGLAVSERVTKKLGELDAVNRAKYQENFQEFKSSLLKKTANWKKRFINKGIKIIGFHKTFNYLFDFLGFQTVGYLEPKPGIPPTAQHILTLIGTAKQQKVKLIIVEDYFDMKAPESLSKQTGIKMVAVPAYTGGSEKAGTYESWLEFVISEIEKGLK